MIVLCHICGEPFFPGQRYYAAPKKEHVSCRKLRELGLDLGGALVELQGLRMALDDDAELEPIYLGPTVVWCPKHARPGGTTGCLRCACEEFSSVLSQIDALVDGSRANDGGPYSVTTYDLDCDPAGVLERVKQMTEANAKNNEEVRALNERCVAIETRVKEAEGLVTPLVSYIQQLTRRLQQ